MEIKKRSHFKNPPEDLFRFKAWVKKLEEVNKRTYTEIEINTSLGKTHIWNINQPNAKDTIVIFPGARTSSLFWDFDRGLDNFNCPLNIFLVETNGLPNLSDGATPDIKSMDYGHWAVEILDGLKIDKTFIAGASFGGLICMKLCIVKPERVKAAFLLNPGCLQPFSLSLRNLYFNLLPILFPSKKNVSKFLDAAVFRKPNHTLSAEAEDLIIDYEEFALTRYKDNTQKPYDMGDQLNLVKSDTYLLEGDKDLLFPYRKSVESAQKRLTNLKDVVVFNDVAHGIETYKNAMNYIGRMIREINHH